MFPDQCKTLPRPRWCRGRKVPHSGSVTRKMMARCEIGLALVAVLGLATASFGEDDKDVTIKDVMKKVHSGKPPVCGKISKGEASKEEKELAVKMYEALSKTKPPKGDDASWKEKTGAL